MTLSHDVSTINIVVVLLLLLLLLLLLHSCYNYYIPSLPSGIFFSKHGSMAPDGVLMTPTMFVRSTSLPPRVYSLVAGIDICDLLRPSPETQKLHPWNLIGFFLLFLAYYKVQIHHFTDSDRAQYVMSPFIGGAVCISDVN